MPPTVLLADDDRATRKLIRAYLVQEGMAVHEASDGQEAVELARRFAPDLVVLDVMMPRMDGFEVLRRLGGGDHAPAVMMLTGRADEIDQLVGYRLGVLDYVVKPVSPKVMAAKVKALLARTAAGPQPAIEVGALRVDVPSRTATCQERPLDLTRRELDVLVALAAHPGWVYTRDQLLSSVWGYDDAGETRLVDMQVANLRRKLGACAELVETVRGVGYRLRPS